MHERRKLNLEIHVIQLLCQRASATQRAKIELIPISDADRAESPASPISSLVIPTWVTERLTVLPVVVVIQ